MNDLISRSRLFNTIATEVHYDTEKPLEMYGKLLQLIQDAPTEPQYAPTKIQFLSARDVGNTFIMGYPTSELIVLAQAMREQGIEMKDLRNYIRDLQMAYEYATGEVMKSIKRSLEGLWDVNEEREEESK